MPDVRRVGLIGFGSIAEHGHLPALQRCPQVDVVAVADVSPQRLTRAASAAPGASLYASPLDLIAEAEVDVLDICSPPSTHGDLMVGALRQGIRAISCEKPFVLGESEYESIRALRAETGARIVSVDNWRSSDLNRLVMEVLNEGSLGDVREVRLVTTRVDAARGNAGWLPAWRVDARHSGGGIVLDHGWHQFYLVFGWMRRPLVAVEARVHTLDPGHSLVEDNASIELFFDEERRARIDLSWTGTERRNEGTIICERGEIEVHDDRIVVRDPSGVRVLEFSDRLTLSSYHPDWFHSYFQSTILDEDGRESDRNFAEAGLLVRTVEAVYRSGRSGGVRVPLAFHGRDRTEARVRVRARARYRYGRSGVSGSPT